MKKTIYCILIALSAYAAVSCGKMMDGVVPKDQISADKLTDKDLTQLTNGTLHQYEAFLMNLWYEGDYYGENFKGGPGFEYADVHGDLQSPSASIPLTRWRYCYNKLIYANLLIKSAELSTNPDSDDVRAARGTGYLFRAMIYNGLVQRYGGVPIIRTANNLEVVPRSTESQVWEFILENLDVAEECLGNFKSIAYPSKEAVWVLKSKVYLWMGMYEKAIQYADMVISSPAFKLENDSEGWAKMFVYGTTSKEIVFAPINIRLTDFIRIYERVNDTDGSFNYSPADDVYANLFSDDAWRVNDNRHKATFSPTDSKVVIKFPNGQSGQFVENKDASQSPLMCYRLADAYLAKAEAQWAKDGNADNALNTLKDFMSNRYQNLNLPASMSNSEFEALILDENRREFYCEGHRWFDVKRMGLQHHKSDFSSWINTQYKGWGGRDFLIYWPIPQEERDLSYGKYTQNPGYAGYEE